MLIHDEVIMPNERAGRSIGRWLANSAVCFPLVFISSLSTAAPLTQLSSSLVCRSLDSVTDNLSVEPGDTTISHLPVL